MEIVRFALGEMQANCYLLIEEDSALLIDPADDAAFILEELQRRNLKLSGIIATHGHFDHVMAAGEIQLSLNVPFYIAKDDRFLIDRLEKTAEHFLGYQPVVVKPTIIDDLKEGKMKISEFDFEIIKTSGHTPGSVCVYFKKNNLVFTGDTIFKQGIGRYDFSYSDKTKLDGSIGRILHLPEETIIYPGHGEDTLVQAEKNQNEGKTYD